MFSLVPFFLIPVQFSFLYQTLSQRAGKQCLSIKSHAIFPQFHKNFTPQDIKTKPTKTAVIMCH